MSPYVRTVRTASDATAVQIVYSNRRGSREIEHIGSAHTPAELEVLKTVAWQRMHANQDALELDDGQPSDQEAPIVASSARHLWEALCIAYQVLGFDRACGQDEVFRLLTLARVVEPTSKLDSIRVLTEIDSPSHLTTGAGRRCHRGVAAKTRRDLRDPRGPGDPGSTT
jgi:hypothetical protein